METTNAREFTRFAAAFFAVLAACACLSMEESAGAESSYEARALSDLCVLKDAMQLYRMDTGAWPDSMRDLMECPDNLEGWAGPYLNGRPMDLWDREYLLFKNEAGIRAGTYGADSLPGGKADYFIDISTGEILTRGVRDNDEAASPVVSEWGWVFFTALALALAVLLWRAVRTSRSHR